MYLKLRMCVPIHMSDIYTCINILHTYIYVYIFKHIWICNTVVDLPESSWGRLSGSAYLCLLYIYISIIGWNDFGSELFGVASWSFGHDVGIPDYDVNVFTHDPESNYRCQMYLLTIQNVCSYLWCQCIMMSRDRVNDRTRQERRESKSSGERWALERNWRRRENGDAQDQHAAQDLLAWCPWLPKLSENEPKTPPLGAEMTPRTPNLESV